MTIILRYDAEKNPHGDYIPGVPLRDLTDDDLRGMGPRMAAGAAAMPCYTPVSAKALAPFLRPADPPAEAAAPATPEE